MKKKLLSYILIAAFLLSGVIINVSDTADAASGKWKQNGKKWSYAYSDGTYPKNKWEKIDGKWYHFDKSGYRQTGWQTIDGKTYYFNGQGVMQTGWRTYGGKKYYFNGQGVMQTGLQTIDGKTYYFNDDGKMQTGWKYYNYNTYYFNAQGEMQTGWRTYNGKKYYFTEWGEMVTGLRYLPGGNAYLFNFNGEMQTGWQKYNDHMYYFNAQGVMQTGWRTYNGKKYYFNEDGEMQTGVAIIGSEKYSFNKDGVLLGKPSDGIAEISTAVVGDYVTFGNYEQDNDISNGNEPILWRVLDKENGRLLLISEYALDCRKYNETYDPYDTVTWETCTIRKWLNSDFYYTAFSSSERSKIQKTTIENNMNPNNYTRAGNNTEDKVFLISADEVMDYFKITKEMVDGFSLEVYGDDIRCKPTAFALGQADENEWEDEQYGSCCRWWLRTPGRDQTYASYVNYFNSSTYIDFYGEAVDYTDAMIRPAIWITIK